MMLASYLPFRCAFWGTNPTEKVKEAAWGGNGPYIRGGHPHPSTGSDCARSTSAGDDREAGGHAEAVQQEVFPRSTKSDGENHKFLTWNVNVVCLKHLGQFYLTAANHWQPWPQSQDPQNREVRQQRFAHFTELAIMSVQEIVDFAKQLPGFLELTREDQIALLKTSTIEVCYDDWMRLFKLVNILGSLFH